MSKEGLPRMVPLLAMVSVLLARREPALLLSVLPSRTSVLSASEAGQTKASVVFVTLIEALPSMVTLLLMVTVLPKELMLAIGGVVPPPIRPMRRRLFTVTVVLLRLRFPVAALM